MRAKALVKSSSLVGIGAASMLWASCVVTVKPAAEPTNEPPPAPISTMTCGPNEYLHGGKHVWRNGAWAWQAPSCVARPATWREGCLWTRGTWARSGNRMVFRAGHLYCPPVAAEPVTEPPSPPPVAVTCGPNEYLQGGKHVWQNGAWAWQAPSCVARPGTWREGCTWVRGSWARVGNRLVFRAGRLSCPETVTPPEPVIADPEDLPPPAPATYRPVRCRAPQIYYAGRYNWNSATRQWDWIAGVCIARPAEYARCKWVPGSWRYHSGRAYYVRPAWNCAGKVTYWTRTGSTWTPPATYSTFITWKPCTAGMRHDAAGRCVRYCGAGTVLKGNRCVALPRPLVCPAGTEKRGNKCVRLPRPLVCPAGTEKRGNKCVRLPKPLICPDGTEKRGNKCVRLPKPLICPDGTEKRGNKCVRLPKPLVCPDGTEKRGNKCVRLPKPLVCPDGTEKRGNKCVRLPKPLICPDGTEKRGNKCVRLAKPLVCPDGTEKRGNKCVRIPPPRVVQPKRCPAGQVLEGGRCVRPTPPPMAAHVKRCPAGQVLEGDRCVRPTPPPMAAPAKRCPAGQMLKGDRCVRQAPPAMGPPPKRCPAGQVLKGNRCVER